MTSGIHRPGGPTGPGGALGPDDAAEVGDASVSTPAATVTPTSAASADGIATLAAAVDSGALRPEQALAQLLDAAVDDDLPAADAAELRAMMSELLATDPYLTGLARDLGAPDPDLGAPDGGGD